MRKRDAFDINEVVELYHPSQSQKDATHIEHFRLAVNKHFNLNLANYFELHKWSCSKSEEFWGFLWKYLSIISSSDPVKIVSSVEKMYPPPKWFEGAHLNFAENLLEPFASSETMANTLAIIQANEHGVLEKLSFKELRNLVRRVASALQKLGVGVGDSVAAYANNRYEIVAFMLAATSLGAVYTASSPDFGPWAVHSRFHQIPKLKVIVSVASYHYNGKWYDHCSKLEELFSFMPEKNHIQIVLLNSTEEQLSKIQKQSAAFHHYIHSWENFLETSSDRPLTYEQLPFDHPVYIMYSSGSTGEPKCIVHGAGGTLLQHKKEHLLHNDIRAGDAFLQITTIAWMMWHWVISALSLGATIVLFDGSPFKPDPLNLWNLISSLNITHFSTSAKYLQLLEEGKVTVKSQKFSLDNLRFLFSTGSPLSPQSFSYVYEKIKSNLHLASITGGTDILSLFAGCLPNSPVYRGQLQCICLGMNVSAFDENGITVKNGTAGDLVCSTPFPCQPIYFGGDDECKSLYRNAYFNTFGDNIWYHGDFLVINPQTNGIIMLGRSDGTLNPAGVRFGSAELYSILGKFTPHLVTDALAVGQQFLNTDDERVILFLKMNDKIELDEALEAEIKANIRSELSPRHVPAILLPVRDIPYTLNGKKAEVIVKKILNNKSIVLDNLCNQSIGKGLANPECLHDYIFLRDANPL